MAFLCILAAMWGTLSSTKGPFSEEGEYDLTGVYGTPSVALKLKDDGTFEFKHDCYHIQATGNWELKGRTVRLLGTKGRIDHLPTRWKVTPDAPCLRSEMKNWEVLRLCTD